jgi:hypothetical protein
MTTAKFVPDIAAIEAESQYWYAQARKGFKSAATLWAKVETCRPMERETHRRTALGLQRRAERDQQHADFLKSRVIALRAKAG